MQKEKRAKNCFEDLTTQLQEEVKLVPRQMFIISHLSDDASLACAACWVPQLWSESSAAEVLYSRCPAAQAAACSTSQLL